MNLEAFLKDVLTPIVDHPEALRIEVTGEGKKRDVIVYAEQGDRGRIIGKSGRNISALRTLCKLAGDKAHLSVNLELFDGDEDEAGAKSHRAARGPKGGPAMDGGDVEGRRERPARTPREQ